ncbi:transposase [Spirochaetia bacterium]|nr:transposase [Spirochaetia bacterium]
MVYMFMLNNKDRYTITEMTDLFGVSRSAYYRWVTQGVSDRRERSDAALAVILRAIQKEHHGRYGAPRIQAELRRHYGLRVSRKRIAKLLKKHGLNAKRRRKFIPTTNSNHGLPVCENILNRDFHASVPGEKWVSDITYLRTVQGWLYLTIVLDLFDRKIIGWAFSEDMTAEHTTIPAFGMAVMNRRPHSGLIFHSDRGVQYCAVSLRTHLKEQCPTVRQSMSRKGNCWDNACAETFFKTLKAELETLDGKQTAQAVQNSVFEYLETYYNRKRMHSALDYSTPVETLCEKVA